MSHSTNEPPDDDAPTPRPRPSWGQPGPEATEATTVLPGTGDGGDGQPPRPSYGQPAQSGQPYGSEHSRPDPWQPGGQQAGGQPAGGQPAGGQPAGAPPNAWAPQGWGQPPNQQPPNQQPYGQQPGWSQPGSPQGSPPGWGQPTPAQYGQDLGRHEQAYAQMYGEKPRTGLSIAAMVLGILGALLCLFPIGSYLAILLGLLALVFGVMGVRRHAGRGMAVTGIVLGGIALVVAILASIFWTRLFVDLVQVATECEQQTGSASGPAFERCVTERTQDYSPFS